VIARSIAPECRGTTEKDGYRNRDRESKTGEEQRSLQPIPHKRPDRHLVRTSFAEVATHGAP
jgi:hypothetical protein